MASTFTQSQYDTAALGCGGRETKELAMLTILPLCCLVQSGRLLEKRESIIFTKCGATLAEEFLLVMLQVKGEPDGL